MRFCSPQVFDVFAAVAHPELTCTHTNGATDTLDSY
jgi:hypothetical protein